MEKKHFISFHLKEDVLFLSNSNPLRPRIFPIDHYTQFYFRSRPSTSAYFLRHPTFTVRSVVVVVEILLLKKNFFSQERECEHLKRKQGRYCLKSFPFRKERCTYILVPEVPKDMLVVTRVTDKPALDECNV